jgi:hypothetical protein
MVQGIVDRLRQRRAAGQLAKPFCQPSVHGLDQRTAVLLTDLLALLRGLAANISLDRIQRSNPLQGFMGKRRVCCDMNVVELPPRVSPTKRQGGSFVRRPGDQPVKTGIAVDLKQTPEAF